MFYYNVTFYCPDSKENRQDHGIVAGQTFVEATNNIMDYYGEEDVVELTLFPLTENNLIVLPHSIAPREIKEDWCL